MFVHVPQVEHQPLAPHTSSQGYNDINAFYSDCRDSGGTASRDITPNPGRPTE